MADKQSFTEREWTTLLMSPTVAGMAITAADPSGIWGTIKESLASAGAIDAAKRNEGVNALIRAVAEDSESVKGFDEITGALRGPLSGAKPFELVGWALDQLGETARILDAKAPDDAGPFKAWLEAIALKVAEASTEGGFLGFGGVRISDAEKATLEDIRERLERSL